ncbi:hypothetical protein KAX75_02705 [candidate division WOR-3 bacterium]|nr:hypothetical protein [candidate division WOR-3 bacterium]
MSCRKCFSGLAKTLLFILTTFLLIISCGRETENNLYGRIEWLKIIDSSIIGYSVQQTSDGGYIVTGDTYSSGNTDIFLLKTDANGNEQWIKTYGGVENDQGLSVQQTFDGGYIIAGNTSSSGEGFEDVYLIKTNSLGDTLWTKTFGGIDDDFGRSVQQTPDSGYIVVGWTKSFGEGLEDVYLIKTNSFGDSIWTKFYGGTDNDLGRSVDQTLNGGFIIVGETESYGAGRADVYIIETDENGETIWTKTYGGEENDVGYSVQLTYDGGYIIAGNTYSFDEFISEILLLKINNNGKTIWSKRYGDNYYNNGYSVQQTPDGGYIITGSTIGYLSGYDWVDFVYLVRTDFLGRYLWKRTYENEELGFGTGYSVKETTDGGFIITGHINSNAFLMKVEP